MAPPTDSEPPAQTPPILDLISALPHTYEVLVVEKDSAPVEFSIPVRSEDQGDSLYGAVHLDFVNSNETVRSFARVYVQAPASQLSDLTRTIRFRLDQSAFSGRDPGCHQLTLFVTHRKNWDDFTFLPKNPQARNDTAVALWWVLLHPESESVSRCPDQEIEQ